MKKVALMICFSLFLLAGCTKPAEVQETPVIQQEEQPQVVEEISVFDGKIIVVDAGHGISGVSRQEAIAPGSSQTKSAFVSGTRGANQTEEELNLAIALILQKTLEEKGALVHMTRTDHTTDKSNIDRAVFGNELNADISVKIHADGSNNPDARGVSMLVPGNQHVNGDVVAASRRAGELVLEGIVAQTGAANRGISVRNDMTGFNWSEVPVILAEVGFMTNPAEDALLETDEYRKKIVSGIVDGLEKYFSETYK